MHCLKKLFISVGVVISASEAVSHDSSRVNQIPKSPAVAQ